MTVLFTKMVRNTLSLGISILLRSSVVFHRSTGWQEVFQGNKLSSVCLNNRTPRQYLTGTKINSKARVTVKRT